jgi:sulfatase maturation enzyme AslB (radical SAM superfamily)
MVDRWNSPMNRSHNKGIHIGFYGGESLLNISFIKEMISYARKTPLKHNFYSLFAQAI